MTSAPSASAFATSAQVLMPFTSVGCTHTAPSWPNAGRTTPKTPITKMANNDFTMFLLPFEQDTVLGCERQHDGSALIKEFSRGAAHGQLTRRPVDDVLDEIAVEEALADCPWGGIGAAIWCTRCHFDVGGANGNIGLAAVRRVRRPGSQAQPALAVEGPPPRASWAGP